MSSNDIKKNWEGRERNGSREDKHGASINLFIILVIVITVTKKYNEQIN